jgi:hypothetical protein
MKVDNPFRLLDPRYHSLPEVYSSRRIASLYDDSTHHIWWLETSEGLMVLKICNSDRIADSFFWRSMLVLFGKNLPDRLDQYDSVYRLVAEMTPLSIPELILAGSVSEDRKYPGFLLAKALPGEMVDSKDVDDQMIMTLAEHLGALHQVQQDVWGGMTGASFSAEQWPDRLQNTLLELSDQLDINGSLVSAAIEQALQCTPTRFVPIMPDLRWDQFLQEEGRITALVDLDAFVWGPAELDFVLLEYLLTEEQSNTFIHSYPQHLNIPNLDHVRKPYRLLLFLMNVLGEKNLAVWMSAPTKF